MCNIMHAYILCTQSNETFTHAHTKYHLRQTSHQLTYYDSQKAWLSKFAAQLYSILCPSQLSFFQFSPSEDIAQNHAKHNNIDKQFIRSASTHRKLWCERPETYKYCFPIRSATRQDTLAFLLNTQKHIAIFHSRNACTFLTYRYLTAHQNYKCIHKMSSHWSVCNKINNLQRET